MSWIYLCVNTNRCFIPLNEFFTTIYSKSAMYHLWYLYSYIALLITAPILKSFAQNMSDRCFRYLILLEIFFKGIIPTFELFAFEGKVSLVSHAVPTWITADAFLFSLIGYYLHDRVSCSSITKRQISAMWMINILTIALACFLTYKKSILTGILDESHSQGYFGSFVIINMITVFLTVKNMFEGIHIGEVREKIILSAGSCCFGVYLFHPLIRKSKIKAFIVLNVGRFSPFIAIIIYCLASFLTCWLITWILKRIPGMRRFL